MQGNRTRWVEKDERRREGMVLIMTRDEMKKDEREERRIMR